MVTKLVKNIFLEICYLLGYYAAYSGYCFTDVSGNLSVPSSRVKKSKTEFFRLCQEISDEVFFLDFFVL
jgi:hypothetical protein